MKKKLTKQAKWQLILFVFFVPLSICKCFYFSGFNIIFYPNIIFSLFSIFSIFLIIKHKKGLFEILREAPEKKEKKEEKEEKKKEPKLEELLT